MKQLLSISIILSLLFFACSQKEETQKPNILLILVDDMGYSDLGCYGSEIATPNIDQLAASGTRFTQFYNSARCCPSRASLMTGLYPHNAGMGHQNQDRGVSAYSGRINDNATTIAEVLSQNNYSTYHVGKWHLGSKRDYWPDKKGFQQFFSLIEGAMNYYNRSPWLKGQDSLEMSYNGDPYYPSKDFYATSTFTDSAISFINKQETEKPFFMYLAFNAPHWPLHAPQKDIEPYIGKYMKGWDTIRANRFAKMKELGIVNENHVQSERFHSVPDWESLSDSAKKANDLNMALYAGVMGNLDANIGRLLTQLEANNQLENTMILFLSDNGGCYEDPVPPNAPWSNHPTDGVAGGPRTFPSYGTPWANVSNTPYAYFKSYLHEGGIITPLIISYPGKVEAGTINTTMIGHISDILPTLVELTGSKYPTQIEDRTITPSDGKSLLGSFLGKTNSSRDTLYWEHEFHRAIRVEDWKLIAPYKIKGLGVKNEWELFNLETDPSEQNDLSTDYPDKVKSMAKAYDKWAKKVGALTMKEMKALQNKKKK